MADSDAPRHLYCFTGRTSALDAPTALILLNSTSPKSSSRFLRSVWRCATLRVVADGAANHLHAIALAGASAGGPVLVPDAIVGDWDSVDPASASFFREHGAALLAQPDDQDSTDLEKCLREVERRQAGSAAPFRVIVYGAFGGRFDHEAQNLNVLYTWHARFGAITLLSGDTIASLLPAGIHDVRVAWPFEGPTVGLVPLGGPADVTTRGLRWDVERWHTSFGGSISTSNAVEGCAGSRGAWVRPVVRIETTAPIVWTLCVNADTVIDACDAEVAAAAPYRTADTPAC